MYPTAFGPEQAWRALPGLRRDPDVRNNVGHVVADAEIAGTRRRGSGELFGGASFPMDCVRQAQQDIIFPDHGCSRTILPRRARLRRAGRGRKTAGDPSGWGGSDPDSQRKMSKGGRAKRRDGRWHGCSGVRADRGPYDMGGGAGGPANRTAFDAQQMKVGRRLGPVKVLKRVEVFGLATWAAGGRSLDQTRSTAR